MLYYFTEIACVVFEVLLIYLFQRSFWNPKRASVWLLLPYLVFGLIITFLSFVPDASILRILISITGITVLSYLVFEVSLWQAFLSGVIFNAIYALNDVLLLATLALFHFDTQNLRAYGSARMVYLVTTHLVLFALLSAIGLTGKGLHSMLSNKVIILLFPCWFSSILLCCLLISSTYSSGMELHPLYILVSVGLLYMNILILWIMEKMERQEKEKQANEAAARHYALQASYYDQLQNQQEDIRALWHDIRKYMRAMQAEQVVTQSSQTWEELTQKVQRIVRVVDVNNRVINIIFNEYLCLAQDAGIRLELDVQVSPELPVAVADLYIILGNTLDNALAACGALPEQQRVIHLVLRQHHDILYYRLDNPFLPDQTQKPRGKNHGLGLKNVRRRVEKYEGNCETRQENGVFTFVAHINCIPHTAPEPSSAEKETAVS